MRELVRPSFSFSGRLNQKAYFIQLGLAVIVGTGVTLVLALVMQKYGYEGLGAAIIIWASVLLTSLWSVSIIVRRLRDVGRSAWHAVWIHATGVVPLIISGFSNRFGLHQKPRIRPAFRHKKDRPCKGQRLKTVQRTPCNAKNASI